MFLSTICAAFLFLSAYYCLTHQRRARRSRAHRHPRGYILLNTVTHARLLPKESTHRFTYPFLAYLVSVEALEGRELECAKGWVFGYGGVGWRLTGLRSQAYVYNEEGTIKKKLVRLLDEHGYDGCRLGDAWMWTVPSCAGFEGINPLTVYFCYRAMEKDVWVVILEIHNTFGERHAHVLEVGPKEDELPVKSFHHTWTFPRAFHVSPFNDRSGFYRVSVVFPSHPPTDSGPGHMSLFNPPVVKVELCTADPSSPSGVGPLKLYAVLRPTTSAYLMTFNILSYLARYPLILFLSLPRILYQAAILHYSKRLDVYPRPEPLSVWQSECDTLLRLTSGGGGIGWQDESWVDRFARHCVERFVEERVKTSMIGVRLIPANPLLPQRHWLPPPTGECKGVMTINYLSSAFFTAILTAPSADHALLLIKSESLASIDSTKLFTAFFSRYPHSSSNRCPRLSFAQRLRMYALPHVLEDEKADQIAREHPIDPKDKQFLSYAAIIMLLVLRMAMDHLTTWVYKVARVRFVAGLEPWHSWDRAIGRMAETKEEGVGPDVGGYVLGSARH